jgi:sulfatase maturation enzyme AslB (radical SAM superfamily)
MIQGGLNLNLKGPVPLAQHCCLRSDLFPIDIAQNFWKDERFYTLRKINSQSQWDPGCFNCKQLEHSDLLSFRQGMNQGLKIQGQTELTGPARIDLMFSISCNLACRSCGAHSSTFWQKHLDENNLSNPWALTVNNNDNKDRVISALEQLDLSNLRQLVFCGGETLLGQEYWDVAEWLVNNVANADKNLTLCFQTNGTQPILPRNYNIINKCHLVKLHISLDGIEQQFEYLRWPAKWNQVVDNILLLRQTLPSNVMFVVEETVSIFNLAYLNNLETWIKQNFVSNREGDVINHSRHLALGSFSIKNCSKEYVSAMQNTSYSNLISANWEESPDSIKQMINTIKQFDTLRNESFEKIFPEVAEFYSRFL